MQDETHPSIFRQTGIPKEPLPTRMPPSSPQAEAAFLGALMANNKVADRAQFLRCEHFADPVNARIFKEALRLIDDKQVADPVTLMNVFNDAGTLNEVGGTGYLASLLTAMVGIVNAGDYARIVRDTWVRRELIDIGEILVNASFGEDEAVNPIKVAMDAIAMIDGITAGSGSLVKSNISLDEAIDAAMDAMETARTGGKSVGISTGFTSLDARLGGLEAGQVYVLAGRPGQGKSALGHQICLSAARRGVPVLEWSLEMSATQLATRTLSSITGIPSAAMKAGSLSQGDVEHLVVARKELRGLPLTINDAAGQTPRMLAAAARAAKRKNGLGLVMLDHLNLTEPDDNDAKHGPTHAIEKASHAMLQIAKDCGVPVIMLTQLSRGVEARDDKRPILSDLRQSGSIEQDAYAVGFIYREEYYLQSNPEQKVGETDDKFASRVGQHRQRQDAAAGRASVIWSKVRDGECGTDSLLFDGPTTTFSEE